MSFDTVDENKAFAEKFSFPFPLLCDVDRALGIAYQACDSADAEYARRITYVIDAEGRIERAIETQDPASQADELFDATGATGAAGATGPDA